VAAVQSNGDLSNIPASIGSSQQIARKASCQIDLHR
jgi:hypothetical protein